MAAYFKGFFLILLVLFSVSLKAQDDKVTSGIRAFEKGAYEEALIDLEQALSYPEELQPENVTRAYYYRALTRLGLIRQAILFNDHEMISKYEMAFLEAYEDLISARKNDDGRFKEKITFQLNDLYNGLLQDGMRAVNLGSDQQKNGIDPSGAFKLAENYLTAALTIRETYLANDLMAQVLSGQGHDHKALEHFKTSIVLYKKELPGNPDFLMAYVFYRKALIERYTLDKPALALFTLQEGQQFMEGEYVRWELVKTMAEPADADKEDRKYQLAQADLKNFELDLLMSMPEEYDQALKRFEETVNESPANYDLLVTYASLLEHSDINRAIETYLLAIDLDNSMELAYFNLGVIYYSRGKQFYEQAGEESDETRQVELLARAKENFKISQPYFEKALEINPDSEEAILALKNIKIIDP